ncbi:vWA domain-containing protein [Bacillus infantis]|uniref:vWA domain-containing protein n=1 Tax=Bacillus infantis TaxID=324767 RepID=UPI0021CC7AB1|nr:VWA domain-containing protein [Bacillus infantis]
MKRKIHILASLFALLCILVLAGCSGEDEKASGEKKNDAHPEEAREQETSSDEKIPEAADDIEGMVAQEPGKILEGKLEPEVEIADLWDSKKYTGFNEQTLQPAAEEEMKAYFSEHKDLSGSQVYDYLVYQLGSGLYQSYYDELVSFEHGHEMPELPDGEDEIQQAKKQKSNIVILMDASGSMKADVSGGNKMMLAKETIKEFTSSLEDDASVSLMAYGHVGTGNDEDKAESCSRIDEVFPLGAYEKTAFNQSMDSFEASGWTPLAGAIDKARELLSAYNSTDYKNTIYIVSDGVETCDGDPVEAARQLQGSNIEAKVNIIGFDVDDEGQQQLKEVAEAGGGTYATVRDKDELEDQVLKKWKPSLGQIFSQLGIPLHETVDQKERLLDISNPIRLISDREKDRIKSAVSFLESEELISPEAAEEAEELAETRHEIRDSHFKDLYEQKEEEAQKARDEINSKVEAWKDKWYEVLKNEN